jgi:hypothetical protein
VQSRSAHAAEASPNALDGKVQGAGSPIAGSTVTLYAASEGTPVQLAQGKTGDDGTFSLNVAADTFQGATGKMLYLVARGGTPKAAAGKGPDLTTDANQKMQSTRVPQPTGNIGEI